MGTWCLPVAAGYIQEAILSYKYVNYRMFRSSPAAIHSKRIELNFSSENAQKDKGESLLLLILINI